MALEARVELDVTTNSPSWRQVDGLAALYIRCLVAVVVVPMADLEFGSMLVEGHRVPEIMHRVRRRLAEWELPGEEADAGDAVEEPQEVHTDFSAEGLLEFLGEVRSII